eukprot:TRINITY_DN22071_c0_g1_i1.p1 TRINITY_DN22071_c0_g1~~TRINITY_DN22071_c0_g1_i1.p1  ORF type:complete len:381 (+),score=74.81 TRINITY_DN22071_c0_g1_i1:1050-2192(+)
MLSPGLQKALDVLNNEECNAVIDLARRGDLSDASATSEGELGESDEDEANPQKSSKRVYSLAGLHSETLAQKAQVCDDLESTYGAGLKALRKACKFVEELLDLSLHEEEQDFPVVHFTPISSQVASAKDRPRRLGLGLHLDTNHRPMRFATAILYLSSLPDDCDGATVFPFAQVQAKDDEQLTEHHDAFRLAFGKKAKAASEEPNEHKPFDAFPSPLCQHTTSAIVDTHSEGSESNETGTLRDLAEKAVQMGEAGLGLSITPKAGKLVLFFSRDSTGCVDPLSFHGGAEVLPGVVTDQGHPAGKWTMQLFRQIPLGEASSAWERPKDCNKRLAGCRARAAASGSGPLVWGVERLARFGAVKGRTAALAKLGLNETSMLSV